MPSTEKALVETRKEKALVETRKAKPGGRYEDVTLTKET